MNPPRSGVAGNKLQFILDETERLKKEGLLINIRTIESAQGAWIQVDGKRVLNLCSNNYLGFANHPRLKEAACKAIEAFGVGPAAVRTIAGTTSLHASLEARLASNWSAAALDGATVSADGLNSDLHGSAEYRAALIAVLAARAVTAAA